MNACLPHADFVFAQAADTRESECVVKLGLRMGILVGAQGLLGSARRTEEKVLALAREKLGPEHPATLTAMGNLALTLKAQGDLGAARQYFEEVLGVRRRVLGAEHPDTSIAAWNLYRTLQDLNERASAQRVRSEHLDWLLARDPATLGAAQRQIRGML
jgi:hypothetical protein